MFHGTSCVFFWSAPAMLFFHRSAVFHPSQRPATSCKRHDVSSRRFRFRPAHASWISLKNPVARENRPLDPFLLLGERVISMSLCDPISFHQSQARILVMWSLSTNQIATSKRGKIPPMGLHYYCRCILSQECRQGQSSNRPLIVLEKNTLGSSEFVFISAGFFFVFRLFVFFWCPSHLRRPNNKIRWVLFRPRGGSLFWLGQASKGISLQPTCPWRVGRLDHSQLSLRDHQHRAPIYGSPCVTVLDVMCCVSHLG